MSSITSSSPAPAAFTPPRGLPHHAERGGEPLPPEGSASGRQRPPAAPVPRESAVDAGLAATGRGLARGRALAEALEDGLTALRSGLDRFGALLEEASGPKPDLPSIQRRVEAVLATVRDASAPARALLSRGADLSLEDPVLPAPLAERPAPVPREPPGTTGDGLMEGGAILPGGTGLERTALTILDRPRAAGASTIVLSRLDVSSGERPGAALLGAYRSAVVAAAAETEDAIARVRRIQSRIDGRLALVEALGAARRVEAGATPVDVSDAAVLERALAVRDALLASGVPLTGAIGAASAVLPALRRPAAHATPAQAPSATVGADGTGGANAR